MPERVSVASSDFIRNIGYWQNEALRRPVGITHHGRERLVLTTPEEFDATRNADADHASSAHMRFDAEAVLENLEDGYVAFDAVLRVTQTNHAADALIGRSWDVLRGVAVADAFPQPFASLLEEKLLRVMRARKPEAFAAAMNDRALSIRVFPLSEGVGVLIDNRTEAQDQRMAVWVGGALCAAANRHRWAAGVKLDVFGRMIGVHDGVCAWLELKREALIGRRLADLVRADQRGAVEAVFESVMLGETAEEIEIALIGGDGREIAVMLSVAPIQADFVTHGAMALLVRSGAAQALRAPMRASA